MTIAYIGIGSNVGDRTKFVRDAVAALEGADGITVSDTSSLYETAPIGGPPQRSFVNLAVKIETDLEPRALLEVCKSVESRFGREPSDIRWGPRVVDLDILLYGDEKVNEPDLEIPHPRLRERKFALIPMLEMEPGVTDPWEARYSDALDEAEGDVEFLEGF
jgi:2-amino-4-hydroxy-6-hydroxymethyldihydropteridine diphosphokinase